MTTTKAKVPTVDPEFQALIPPLTDDEYRQLEENVVRDGCRDALVTWQGTLLDGHNRLRICQEHGLNYLTFELPAIHDRDDAKAWIITNQFGRRNLTPYQRSELALELEPLIAEKAKEKKRESGGAVPQKSAKPPIDTRAEVARAAGVSHDTIAKAKKLRDEAPEEVKDKLRRGDPGVSINSAYRDLRREGRRRSAAEKVAPTLPPGQFGLIYCDPPWRYDHACTQSRAIENQYPTMTIDEICALEVPAAEDCVLFLWATAPKLREALRVVEAWGFTYKTHAIWDKQKIGMGYWFRGQHELLLVAVRGDVSPPPEDARVASVLAYPRNGHSEKPAEVYGLIQAMFPHTRRIELFARGKRKGWATWGNEA